MANKDAYEEQMDRREFRRKRRIRNQIISYIVTVIVLGGLVAGGIIGAGQVMKTVRDKKQADELQKQLASARQLNTTVAPAAPTSDLVREAKLEAGKILADARLYADLSLIHISEPTRL